MTIAFPRAMPLYGVGVQRFELQRVDFLSPRTDGRLNGITAGFPLWSATWTLTAMSPDRRQEWRAWVASLRGPQRQFYGTDLTASLPLAYRATGLGAFGGDAASWSINTDRDVLTLTGLPSGFKLSPGDYVGFRWGTTKRAIVRVLEAGTGATISFSVEPALPSVVPGSAIAHVKDAACLMRLTPETEIGEIGVDGILSGKIAAIQDLIP